jgi:hypothetical protein
MNDKKRVGQTKVWETDREKKLSEIRSGRKAYVLSDPDGVQYTIENGMLNEFCNERGLPTSSLSSREVGVPLIKGRARGWTVISRT